VVVCDAEHGEGIAARFAGHVWHAGVLTGASSPSSRLGVRVALGQGANVPPPEPLQLTPFAAAPRRVATSASVVRRSARRTRRSSPPRASCALWRVRRRWMMPAPVCR
jgi:hypothetical protein